jgi:hypothetical protein
MRTSSFVPSIDQCDARVSHRKVPKFQWTTRRAFSEFLVDVVRREKREDVS